MDTLRTAMERMLHLPARQATAASTPLPRAEYAPTSFAFRILYYLRFPSSPPPGWSDTSPRTNTSTDTANATQNVSFETIIARIDPFIQVTPWVMHFVASVHYLANRPLHAKKTPAERAANPVPPYRLSDPVFLAKEDDISRARKLLKRLDKNCDIFHSMHEKFWKGVDNTQKAEGTASRIVMLTPEQFEEYVKLMDLELEWLTQHYKTFKMEHAVAFAEHTLDDSMKMMFVLGLQHHPCGHCGGVGCVPGICVEWTGTWNGKCDNKGCKHPGDCVFREVPKEIVCSGNAHGTEGCTCGDQEPGHPVWL